MLSALTASTNTPLLKQAARFAERRQEVLAGNIANIDTPGYRMRDLPVADFRQAMQRALAASRPPRTVMSEGQPQLWSPLTPGIEPTAAEDFFPEQLFRAQTPREQPGITFQDANNRSVEHQFLEMTKNALWQQFAVQVLQGQYDQLQAVISERP